MKKFLLIASFVVSSFLHADVVANQEVIAATNVMRSFGASSGFHVDQKYLQGAKAVAILTDVKRLAAGASIQYGDGIFSVKNADGTWSAPIFIKYKGFGVGIQAGYETSDVVLLFHTTKSYQDVFTGADTLEVSAGAAFGGHGAKAGRATDLPDISAWIATPGEQTGLYAGVTIDSGRITIDDQLTNDYYERIYAYEDILNDSPRNTEHTKNLKNVLYKYLTMGNVRSAKNVGANYEFAKIEKKYADGKPIVSDRPYKKGAKASKTQTKK
ncbi:MULTISPECIES: lipid-binding SYLF domain-containing protein [unclassified Campylobacter]|uniref:lipid-binding SYLF domain-containing protein n=1 Tax=unclassified Campylobacter TaxID=2593542 RepID=UPI0022E9FC69|nr:MULTISPECIES: lipid-binding SYLF domain-containing protein [unclassified Campylobacter]MDA3048867.1 lipid-binding SYLF domain-containing protein [Campylobacter sp. JMF_15 NE4]MDA3050422.1 lipid-binding SYLF domain-containing protein [Campylobacter sp. JMF_02 ED1]MDA3054994.1 lipid-binding SYLF domain-containing protein [Campylobacter sp. VBCF_07 NA4]MDA3060496.1 lipid-binding SYLF domain-containing protein [Campylobacter sp. VBCF_02 NA5]MDA3061929.1 lipid-binding SYLF domain-containing prot